MASKLEKIRFLFSVIAISSLTKKAEPPPTRDVNRDSGTDNAIGGWLQRLVRPLATICKHKMKMKNKRLKIPRCGCVWALGMTGQKWTGCCGASDADGNWFCAKPKGHDGNHVAC